MDLKDLKLSDALYERYSRGDDTTAAVPVKAEENVIPEQAVVTDSTTETKPETDKVVDTATDTQEEAATIPEDDKSEEEPADEESNDDLSFDAEDLELNLPDDVSEEEVTALVEQLHAANDIEGIVELVIANMRDIEDSKSEALRAKEYSSKLASDWLGLMEKINPMKEKVKELEIIKNDPVLSKLIGKGDEDIAATMMSYLSEKNGLNLWELIEKKKKEMSQDASDMSEESETSGISIWSKWSMSISDWLTQRYAN